MSWIDEVVQAELAPWREGIDRRLLDEAKERGEVNLQIKIVNSELRAEELRPGFQTRHATIVKLFREALARHPIANVEFVINAGDCGWRELFDYPVFIQSKPLECKCISFPDFSFGGWPEIGEPSWAEFQAKMYPEAERNPWNERQAQVYFRGAPTHDQRKRFHALAQQNDFLDIVVVDWANNDHATDVRTPLYEPFTNTCRYKYALNLPGIGWCVRYKYLFTTGCLVFKVLQAEREFWEDMLRPFEDYIPIDPRMADEKILSLISSYVTHDSLAQKTAQNGMAKVKSLLTTDAVYEYIAKLLNAYSPLQRWKP